MKRLLKAGLIAAVISLPALGSALAEESRAKSWNLTNQEKARFQATVVDIACELSGNCPANCGDGSRQLGLVKEDGQLVMVGKNGQPLFTGATEDLLPYCGQKITVDGLFTGLTDGPRFYQVQFIRAEGDTEDRKADRWTKQWDAQNPDLAKKKGRWYRKDPTVTGLIAQEGYLGLGHPADKEFLEWFE